MNTSLKFCLLLSIVLSFFSCDPSKKAQQGNLKALSTAQSFDVKLFQHGKEVEILNNVAVLSKEEFTIMLVTQNLVGVYSRISLENESNTMNLGQNAIIESLSSRVMAETAFNADKEVMISDDSFCYWFLDPAVGWHRLNRAFEIDNKKILEKDVVQLWLSNEEKVVNLKDLNQNMSLVFFAAQESSNKIIQSNTVEIQWR